MAFDVALRQLNSGVRPLNLEANMDDKSSLENKLTGWLESQGYPLEMLVASTFRKVGFYTVQSEYYSDPDSGAAREVDVVAYLQREVQGIYFRVKFVIECKLARDKPWVLFTSHRVRLADPARIAQRAASLIGDRLLRKLAHRKDMRDHLAFKLAERSGYGLTQAFTSGQDVTYSAAMSVAKAALAQTLEADFASEVQFPVCEIVFPVIVIDGKLFEYYLEKDTEPHLQEIDSGMLLWRNQLVKNPHTIIHIVTASSLEKFVSDANEITRFLLTACDSELEEFAVASKLRRRTAKRKKIQPQGKGKKEKSNNS